MPNGYRRQVTSLPTVPRGLWDSCKTLYNTVSGRRKESGVRVARKAGECKGNCCTKVTLLSANIFPLPLIEETRSGHVGQIKTFHSPGASQEIFFPSQPIFLTIITVIFKTKLLSLPLFLYYCHANKHRHIPQELFLRLSQINEYSKCMIQRRIKLVSLSSDETSHSSARSFH